MNNDLQETIKLVPEQPGCYLYYDKDGEIICINQAIYNPDNNISNIGIGFAIPINLVKEYLKEDSNI